MQQAQEKLEQLQQRMKPMPRQWAGCEINESAPFVGFMSSGPTSNLTAGSSGPTFTVSTKKAANTYNAAAVLAKQ